MRPLPHMPLHHFTNNMFKYPLVALIGRTNVGKSTLFNRLTGKRTALVSETAGTTRDVRFGECDWRGQKLMLADTAGLNVESIEAIDVESIKKAKEAIIEADVVLLIVDGKEGLVPEDLEYARMLRQSGKPVILVVNKIDSKKYFVNTDEFGNLGFKETIGLSSRTGSGTGDLLDMIFEKTKDLAPKELLETTEEDSEKPAEKEVGPLRISLIGRPNVGKSSLFNKIIGQERAIVSPVAHTTRESQDMEMLYESEGEKHRLIFVDTAGLVQHRKIKDKLKGMSIEQSLDSIDNCDLVLFIIAADEEITGEDRRIASEILERGRSLIFVINKWDLVPGKTTKSDKNYTEFLYAHFPFLTWAPIIFVSAKTGHKLSRLMEEILVIDKNQNIEISQKDLDKLLEHIMKKRTPDRTTKDKSIHGAFIHKIKQTGRKPLRFEITADHTENLGYPYVRFIQHQIREHFNLAGTGIIMNVEERHKKKHHQS
jgi:GTP-binding protein